MSNRFDARRDALRKELKKLKLPGLIVQKEPNVTYLTGFTGEDSVLLLLADREILVTDSRFVTQLADECPGLPLHVRKTSKSVETMDKALAELLTKSKLPGIGIEADTMTVGLRERISENAKTVQFASTRGLVEDLRAIKDKLEIAEIEQAVGYAEQAFQLVRKTLQPDLTEVQVAHQLEASIRELGGKGFSFGPIVAAGPRAALPHGRASQGKIGASGLLLIDWGAVAERYVSDLTRVLVTGKISPKVERIYQVVFKAQAAGIAQIRPGAVCGDVDAAARQVIEDAGFGKFFGHGLGHGIGMEVHEQPRFSVGSKQILRAGMVVTVEPGIYLPGIGGVRLEDDVLVTKTGHRVLSSLGKTWDDARQAWAA
jgi:Xaa-Pro aminopeptidase